MAQHQGRPAINPALVNYQHQGQLRSMTAEDIAYFLHDNPGMRGPVELLLELADEENAARGDKQ